MGPMDRVLDVIKLMKFGRVADILDVAVNTYQ